jgi:hypothetical protein
VGAARRASARREKRCSVCKRVKPLSDFGVRSVSPDGRHPWCRSCARDYRRRWTESNREVYRASQRAYRRRNRKRLRRYNREYQRRRRALMRLGKWDKTPRRAVNSPPLPYGS